VARERKPLKQAAAYGGEMSLSRPLFTSVDFQNSGHRLTGDGIYKIVKRLFKRAGVEKHMSPHRCRHRSLSTSTFSSWQSVFWSLLLTRTYPLFKPTTQDFFHQP
jgi:integrase